MIHPDANRCLLCKRPRCGSKCPVHTDVPGAMRLYKEGKNEEAGALLFDNNPMSSITCRVCDWKRFCFGNCVLNVKKMPIHWYEIEHEISGEYIKNYHITTPEDKGKSIAILGAGPAGITAAIRLRQDGFHVVVYDNHDRIGGVLRYGIPEFRLGKECLDPYERIFRESGIEFHGGVVIGKDVTIEKIRAAYDAVLLATGAVKPRSMRIPGEDNPHVHQALDFLSSPGSFKLGKKVIVVGGGNVAMDVSRTLVRLGHWTINYYRKDFPNMPANSREVAEAKQEGVEFRVLQTPVEIKVSGGKNIAVIRDCQTITNPDGTLSTEILPGTDNEIEFDDLIQAVSETVDYSVFDAGGKPKTDKAGIPLVNGLQETSLPNVFIAGDFFLGPKTVVDAVHSANIATEGIEEYLREVEA